MMKPNYKNFMEKELFGISNFALKEEALMEKSLVKNPITILLKD